ncbi:MAG: DUF3298 domain-containing protein [Saprospiraceae bacterium]
MTSKNVFFLVGLIPMLVFSCKNDPPASSTPLLIDKEGRNIQEGADCDKPDSLRLDCTVIDLGWPKLTDASEALKANVSTWSNAFTKSLLAMDPDAPAETIDDYVREFIEQHRTFRAEAPDSPMGQWTAESSFEPLMNDGKYLTLKMDGYSFAGGAHGNPAGALATWNVATGQQLTWDDLVTDKAQMLTLAEAAFRKTRPELFEGEYPHVFDEIFPFKLPESYGLVEKGIYFLYAHYEVGPYAIGSTEFVIPFEELGDLKK